MNINLTSQFKKDFKKLKVENKKFSSKLMELIIEIDNGGPSRQEGLGKPELLKGNLAGCWSRRIDGKHRLIYRFNIDNTLTLLSCYGHYSDK